MNVNLRWIRLRLVWLLVPPFFYFARPTLPLLAVGLAWAIPGALIRAWGAGVLDKDRVLAVSGPFAYTRNPLYLGTLLVGLGVTVAGGRPGFVIAFAAFFALVYTRTMRHEERWLEERFGDEFRVYARHVPLLVPRLRPFRPEVSAAAAPTTLRFELKRYLGNREYQTALGILAGFLGLAVLL
ncbi:MAG: isoprenylcysteine carboxylmethyltransferase family protein [Gemmatimonadetes bacterium]|nr:isoprenylcysteine carboxylmethyltransferase family protein [Gemmatimonadota bacterium]